jgi:hypothetical protein
MTAPQEGRDPVSPPPIDVPRLRSWVENGRHVTDDRDRWLADTVDALLTETDRLRAALARLEGA